MSQSTTVIIRSFNRVPTLVELLNRLVYQQGVDFDVTVVEQSEKSIADLSREIEKIENNGSFSIILFNPENTVQQRIREANDLICSTVVGLKAINFYLYPPLGGALARNKGVYHSNSDVLIFIDDDDLPIGSDWILKHVNAHQDYPNMIGLTGRHLSIENEICPYLKIARPFISKKVLSYNFLKFPYTFARFDESVEKVKWVHGTNSSIKKEWITKVGGWDDSVKNQDEHSFAFKIAKIKGKENYFSFDANIPLLRRTDIPGGMGKRTFSISREIKNQWSFITKIVKTYHPVRFYLLFPIYIILIIIRLIQKALTRLPKP